MTSSLYFIIAGIVGYLLGSIPWGLILVKLAGLGDMTLVKALLVLSYYYFYYQKILLCNGHW
jgi:glycerol-3-phosphate acyltransferase PlsY